MDSWIVDALFLLLGIGALPLVAWGVSRASRAARKELTRAGFVKEGDRWLRAGVAPVEAHFIMDDTSERLVLTGPSLPEGAPGLEPADSEEAPLRTVVTTGDDRFDADVRTQFPRPAEALAWLSADVRTHARRAVKAGARLERGQWQATLSHPIGPEVTSIAKAIARASQAMAAAPPGVDEGLRARLADPDPGVRVQAMHALVERGGLEPHELDALAKGPYAEVHVAVIGLGGEPARVAFRELRRNGGRGQRAEGAIELGRRRRRGDVELDGAEVEALIGELLNALEHDDVGDRAARELGALDRPDLPRRLGERFGADAPPRVQALRKALAAKLGDAARGAVSVVSAEGGGLAVAEPPPPPKAPEGS